MWQRRNRHYKTKKTKEGEAIARAPDCALLKKEKKGGSPGRLTGTIQRVGRRRQPAFMLEQGATQQRIGGGERVEKIKTRRRGREIDPSRKRRRRIETEQIEFAR